MNWSELPDLTAVTLLACAFASVSRRSPTPVSGIWLTGWLMIVLHFGSFLFLTLPGVSGTFAAIIGLSALIWAGFLFMWAAVPYRSENSSRWMFGVLATSNTLYVAISSINPVASWALTPAAIFLGASPLLVALWVVRKFNRRLRWLVVSLYAALSIFVLLIQHRAADGPELALNAVLFTVYFGCCLHFWYGYRRGTTGAFITIAGFLAWSLVFVAAPIMEIHFPAVHIESEVWNLPKYVVAVGMILLLLEDQIEYNRHLALHDHLTGLPNRRLFQDRLASALERARRTETRTALLIVDLDRFKQVNDTFGHHAGDLVLQQVAAKFSARVRRSDTVARTGGDEFSVILEEPTSREQAVVVGMSLMQLLNEPLKVNPDQSACIGASVGVAIFPEDAHDMESLCIAADRRMYAFKHDSEEPIVKEVFVGPTPLAAFKPQSHRPVTVADQFGVVRGKL
ncbi:MAG: diguanylate cyclase [Terracidiphilus sp.]